MGVGDKVYDGVIQDILTNGVMDSDQVVRTKWADGTPAYTKSIITAQMKFDNTEVPIVTKKKTAWKTAAKEILKFWQEKTNSFESFHRDDIRIWDEWQILEGEWEGTIGPSYGYQMGLKTRMYPREKVKVHLLQPENQVAFLNSSGPYFPLDQVDFLLQELVNNPASRRHVTSLWNIHHLDEMALNPCVWNTQWLVKQGHLHLIVGVRSNDMALGNPFNVFQYYLLQRMITQVTGYKLGTLTFNINDAHIYDRHIEPLTQQLSLPDFPAPTLNLNPDIKNFYEFTMDDFEMVGYEHGPAIRMEVAI